MNKILEFIRANRSLWYIIPVDKFPRYRKFVLDEIEIGYPRKPHAQRIYNYQIMVKEEFPCRTGEMLIKVAFGCMEEDLKNYIRLFEEYIYEDEL